MEKVIEGGQTSRPTYSPWLYIFCIYPLSRSSWCRWVV